MVQCGLEDRQNAVRGGATLANPVRTLVRLALVRLADGLGARERWLCGKAAVPIFDPLDREFGDLQSVTLRLGSFMQWRDDTTLPIAIAVTAPWRAERRIICRKREPRQSTSAPSILVVVTRNFLHEHHDPAPQGRIINTHERSDQP